MICNQLLLQVWLSRLCLRALNTVCMNVVLKIHTQSRHAEFQLVLVA
jgi:hypothetical protein